MSKFTHGLALFIEKHPTLYKGFLLLENAFKKPVMRPRLNDPPFFQNVDRIGM